MQSMTQFMKCAKMKLDIDVYKRQILWLIFGGLELCITNIVSGLILCITIVGIPFAAQSFKMAKLALMPFGKEVI